LKAKGQENLSEDEQSIFQKLVKVDRKVAMIMAGDLVGAGVDTVNVMESGSKNILILSKFQTSVAVSVILYCLAKNPEKQDKLREEIMKILPEKDTPFIAEKMKNIPYLKAVIKEGLRMFPPIAGTMRKAGQDLVLQGYQVPKGVKMNKNYLYRM
jgi:cytochrome P450 family 12